MGQTNNKREKADVLDKTVYKSLIEQLWSLRKSMLEQELVLAPWLVGVDPSYRASSRNFAHYLALRHADRRPLQESLDQIGVSSLGRAESNVLANLDKVLGILVQLAGEPWQSHCKDEPASIQSSRKLLEQHTTALLGPPPPGRAVRIMVTLPSEAASNFGLVRQLADSGMDIARINCAHDGAAEWQAMAANVRRASEVAGRTVRILMDLRGPKLRTGPIAAGPAVLKLRPLRDEFGRVLATAQVSLRPTGTSMTVVGATAQFGVDADWVARLEPGDHLDFTDASGADRSLVVVHRDGDSVLAECARTAHLVLETRIKRRRIGPGRRTTRLYDLPCQEGTLHLERGSHLRLTRDETGELSAEES